MWARGGNNGATTAKTGSANTPLQWAGQYKDASTGRHYMRARYHDAVIGQFLTRDPLLNITGAAYNYAGNDPINWMDPSGLCIFCWDAVDNALETVHDVAGAVSTVATSVVVVASVATMVCAECAPVTGTIAGLAGTVALTAGAVSAAAQVGIAARSCYNALDEGCLSDVTEIGIDFGAGYLGGSAAGKIWSGARTARRTSTPW